jgi:hypothetical protein
MPESFAETAGEVEALLDPVLHDDPDLVRWHPSVGECAADVVCVVKFGYSNGAKVMRRG